MTSPKLFQLRNITTQVISLRFLFMITSSSSAVTLGINCSLCSSCREESETEDAFYHYFLHKYKKSKGCLF